MFWHDHLKICQGSKVSSPKSSQKLGEGEWRELENGTFRQRGEEAATLNPETAPRSHAQAVFLWVLSENHLLQHWGDRNIKKSRQIVLLALHKQNQWGTIHGSWRRGTLRLQEPRKCLRHTLISMTCSLPAGWVLSSTCLDAFHRRKPTHANFPITVIVLVPSL